MDSRVDSTRVVGQAIEQASRPPRLWLQASTATVYAHRFDAPNDEASGVIGGNELDAPKKWGYSIEVAKAWEQAANEAHTPRTRKVPMRSAIILSPDRSGIFDTLLRLVRFGLGGNVAGGKQMVSWIHETDFVRSVQWLIQHEEMDGVVNLASPNPLPYSDFMRTLRRAWGIPIGLPATKWMLEIAAFFMQTESELILKSRYVVPTRMQQSGFEFKFADWEKAAKDLCERWKAL
jgi:hypothetical protein